MIYPRSHSIGTRNMQSFAIQCNTPDCQSKENFTGTDETQAESNAFKRGWNIVRVGPRIEHYCRKCARRQMELQTAKARGGHG